MTLFNVGDVVFLNVTSGISPDPDWQLGVVTRATNSYGWTSITLKELRHPQAAAYWPSRSALAARR